MKIKTLQDALDFRAKIESAAQNLDDNEAVNGIDLFPVWVGTKNYVVGNKVRYQNKLYKCYQNIAANETWTPDVVASSWEVISPSTEQGTLENPYTAAVGMRYIKGKYYKEGEDIYLCIRDDTGEGTILHYWPSVLVGNYFTKVN